MIVFFSQKVRNTVSHRAHETSLEQQLVAIYGSGDETWTLTPRGWSIDLRDIR